MSSLYLGMQDVHTSLDDRASPRSPSRSRRRCSWACSSSPTARRPGPLQVQFNPATLEFTAPVVTVRTDATGAFTLPLPKGMPLPAGSQLALQVHGANAALTVSLPSAAGGGQRARRRRRAAGVPRPAARVDPRRARGPGAARAERLAGARTGHPAEKPVVKLGEHDGCLSYGVNTSVDRFPYGVFFRLVEPRTSIVSRGGEEDRARAARPTCPVYATSYVDVDKLDPQTQPGPGLPITANGDGAEVDYVDRVPVEQPISVDGFRDQLMGLQDDGTFTADETRPMAGTLGLGYVLYMSQRWTLQGLGLGDLVYSLPLAPGSSSRSPSSSAPTPRGWPRASSSPRSRRSRRAPLADTSTQATFASAFQEAVNGSSLVPGPSRTPRAGASRSSS